MIGIIWINSLSVQWLKFSPWIWIRISKSKMWVSPTLKDRRIEMFWDSVIDYVFLRPKSNSYRIKTVIFETWKILIKLSEFDIWVLGGNIGYMNTTNVMLPIVIRKWWPKAIKSYTWILMIMQIFRRRVWVRQKRIHLFTRLTMLLSPFALQVTNKQHFTKIFRSV